MECSSQMVLKTFIFILVVQVKYTDGLSVDPDAVKDITSTFPGKIRVTDWLNTHSGMSPVSLRRTQVRLKAHGGYFLYQNYTYGQFFTFSAALIPMVFFSGPVHISPVHGSAALLILWISAARKFEGQGAH